MKTIEAVISALALLSVLSMFSFTPHSEPSQLYNYQLAEDVWRVAYLRGCFQQEVSPLESFNAISMANLTTAERIERITPGYNNATNQMEECLNNVIVDIESETALKIEFGTPLEATSNALPPQGAIVIQKTILLNGIPQTISLSVGGRTGNSIIH